MPPIAERIQNLELVLGLCFQNKGLLQLGLTHSSYANESKGNINKGSLNKGNTNNERLELLGDSILGFCITEYLYLRFPERNEGQLSQLKSYIVSAESLAEVAREYKLGRFILLGRGEDLDGGRDKDSVLANAVESVIGAYYLDQGIQKARELVLYLLSSQLQHYQDNPSPQDVKLRLQEYVQKKYKNLPLYKTAEISGPTAEFRLKASGTKQKAARFRADLYIDGEFICSGEGSNKKQAEKQAAKFALEHIIDVQR